jgi:hypothetical protein
MCRNNEERINSTGRGEGMKRKTEKRRRDYWLIEVKSLGKYIPMSYQLVTSCKDFAEEFLKQQRKKTPQFKLRLAKYRRAK